MNSKIIAIGIIKAVVALVGLVFLFLGMYRLKTLLVYLIISAVLALIFRPLLHFFINKLRITKVVATAIVMLVIILIISGVIRLLIPLLISQGRNFSTLDFEKLNETISVFLLELGVESSVLTSLKVYNFFNVTNFSQVLNTLVAVMGELGMGVFSVLFMVFFFLKDGNKIAENIIGLAEETYIEKIKQVVESIKSLLSRYFIGLLVQMTIIFVVLTVVLLTFGVKDALIIAFFCALLNVIPYLGPIIGAIFISVLTMSNFISEDFSAVIFPKTFYVLISFLVVQLIDNLVSQPIIFSNSVKSHPLEIFLVILVAGTLFGVSGMIIAVPFYTVIRVILKALFAENKLVKLLTKNL